MNTQQTGRAYQEERARYFQQRAEETAAAGRAYRRRTQEDPRAHIQALAISLQLQADALAYVARSYLFCLLGVPDDANA